MSDINKRIAVEVMGWRLVDYTEQGLKYHSDSKWVENDPPIDGDGYIQYRGGRRMSEFDFKPDTDIADAFLVVERINELHSDWRFCLLGGDTTDSGFFGWKAEWFGCFDAKKNCGDRHAQAFADTAPMAICKAALKVMEGSE